MSAVGDVDTRDLVVIGRITSVYGIKGWVKIYSYTEPMDNILGYKTWWLNRNGRWETVKVEQGKRHGKGLIAKLAGCNERESARNYCEAEIAIPGEQLPQLEDGEYYWSQLEKLNVITESGVLLGKVDHLIATGANDVLVVRGTEDSLDRKERLIPYLPDQVIKQIDLQAGEIRVDWDPEF